MCIRIRLVHARQMSPPIVAIRPDVIPVFITQSKASSIQKGVSIDYKSR